MAAIKEIRWQQTSFVLGGERFSFGSRADGWSAVGARKAGGRRGKPVRPDFLSVVIEGIIVLPPGFAALVIYIIRAYCSFSNSSG